MPRFTYHGERSAAGDLPPARKGRAGGDKRCWLLAGGESGRYRQDGGGAPGQGAADAEGGGVPEAMQAEVRVMTYEEAKKAFDRQEPVLFKGVEYRHINAIIFRRRRSDRIVQLELQDIDARSVTVADMEKVMA